MEITGFSVRKMTVPCEPSISDSQYEFDTCGIVYLELETDGGETGIGIGGAPADLTPEILNDRFDSIINDLIGTSPFSWCNRITRPRGGNHQRGEFYRAIDCALWDLCGKHLDMPLYKLLGGQNPEVPTYGSGLAFSHDDAQTEKIYREFKEEGINAAKVKVGYPTLEEDIERLSLVQDILGHNCTLMIDANEAWSPKEAIRRANAYNDAGFDIYIFEDPILRDDIKGHQQIKENMPFSHLNTGEYVNLEGKRRLLENGALDMLNIRNGIFSTALDEAVLAAAYGIPVHVGDAHCEIGIHLAAALPEVSYIEYWKRPWDKITDNSVGIENGKMIAPNRPGHGITISDEAFEAYGE